MIPTLRLAKFGDEGIRFYNYPYPPACVFPAGTIGYDQIVEINDARQQVKTKNRETLFVGSEKRLRALAAERGVPVARRVDLWGLIAEPFLDRGYGEEEAERTLRVLERNGVGREEVRELRAELEHDMLEYNAWYWEWVDFDMREVLDVRLGKLWRRCWRRQARREFEEFYWRFMEVADRAELLDGQTKLPA